MPNYENYRVGVRDERGSLVYATETTFDLNLALDYKMQLSREISPGYRAVLLFCQHQTPMDPTWHPCTEVLGG